jgi:hypothetical protein
MDDETKKRLKSFAKLVALVFLVGVIGYLVLTWAGRTLSEHFGKTPTAQCNNDHRFQQVDVYPVELRGDVALDTCTGQLCKTWQWTAQSATGAARMRYEGLPLRQLLAGRGSAGGTTETRTPARSGPATGAP